MVWQSSVAAAADTRTLSSLPSSLLCKHPLALLLTGGAALLPSVLRRGEFSFAAAVDAWLRCCRYHLLWRCNPHPCILTQYVRCREASCADSKEEENCMAACCGVGGELKQRLSRGDTAVATVSAMDKVFTDRCVLLWHDHPSLLPPLTRWGNAVTVVNAVILLPIALQRCNFPLSTGAPEPAWLLSNGEPNMWDGSGWNNNSALDSLGSLQQRGVVWTVNVWRLCTGCGSEAVPAVGKRL